MYLHLGQNTVIRDDKIIGIFDMETSTISGITRKYLSRKQKENNVVNVSMEMPKSFIPCSENGKTTVYISQISTSTLQKRAKINQSNL